MHTVQYSTIPIQHGIGMVWENVHMRTTPPLCAHHLLPTGALVGPPWSKRQNGYVLREAAGGGSGSAGASLYYEPHCDFDVAAVTRVGQVKY